MCCRAAQKLSKKKKRQQSQEPEPPSYPTSYGHVIRLTPPPAPPCLLRTVGRLQNPGVGKVRAHHHGVRVLLHLCLLNCFGESCSYLTCSHGCVSWGGGRRPSAGITDNTRLLGSSSVTAPCFLFLSSVGRLLLQLAG